MVRKLATQVPQFVSRLLQADLLSTPPTWYQPVLSNPPPVLPPRQVIARSRPTSSTSLYPDLPRASASTSRKGKRYPREPKPRPAAIVYDEDRIRRQFFRDFPFEALRPVSLVESAEVAGEHGVNGSSWTKLEQRGSYPTVEDTISFTVNLHKEQNISLSDAYEQATTEFVALRAKHEMATLVAEDQARALGAEFKRDAWDRAYDQQTRALSQSSSSSSSTSLDSSRSTKYRTPSHWTASIASSVLPSLPFTGGVEYVSQWSMPAAAVPSSAAPARGDLVSAIGSAAPVNVEMSEAEMSDVELLDKFLNEPVVLEKSDGAVEVEDAFEQVLAEVKTK